MIKLYFHHTPPPSDPVQSDRVATRPTGGAVLDNIAALADCHQKSECGNVFCNALTSIRSCSGFTDRVKTLLQRKLVNAFQGQ